MEDEAPRHLDLGPIPTDELEVPQIQPTVDKVVSDLAAAIKKVKKDHGVDYFEAVVSRSLESDKVMIALFPYIFKKLDVAEGVSPLNIQVQQLFSDAGRPQGVSEKVERWMTANYSIPLRSSTAEIETPKKVSKKKAKKAKKKSTKIEEKPDTEFMDNMAEMLATKADEAVQKALAKKD